MEVNRPQRGHVLTLPAAGPRPVSHPLLVLRFDVAPEQVMCGAVSAMEPPEDFNRVVRPGLAVAWAHLRAMPAAPVQLAPAVGTYSRMTIHPSPHHEPVALSGVCGSAERPPTCRAPLDNCGYSACCPRGGG